MKGVIRQDGDDSTMMLNGPSHQNKEHAVGAGQLTQREVGLGSWSEDEQEFVYQPHSSHTIAYF